MFLAANAWNGVFQFHVNVPAPLGAGSGGRKTRTPARQHEQRERREKITLSPWGGQVGE